VARTAEVVAVGDELLSGARVNTNASWIGAALSGVGIEVVRGTVVGDDPAGIADALRAAAARTDVVIVTGGLGPTSDDRTVEAVALLLGAGLRRDADVAARITAYYVSRGRDVTEQALTQADVPVGAATLTNPVGSAPGLRAEIDGVPVFVLPGVPAEMKAIVTASILPEFSSQGGRVPVATLRTVLVPESEVARIVTDVERRAVAAGVRVAYLPSAAEVVLRFVGRVGLEAEVATFEAEAAALLGDRVAVRGDATLAHEVTRLATAAGATVAAAESLTGGSLTDALTESPGASAVLRGGVVAYATELKHELLGVDSLLLDERGAVDADVAIAMARGVRARLGAVYGVATTGVAGPDRQDGKPPGVVHVAVSGPRGDVVVSPLIPGDRARVRLQTVTYALELLRRSLLGLDPPAVRESATVGRG
jgi:nicotinamide-nucleotide amidase